MTASRERRSFVRGVVQVLKFSRGTRRVIMAWHATTKGVSRTCDIELSMAAVCLDIHVLHASTTRPYLVRLKPNLLLFPPRANGGSSSIFDNPFRIIVELSKFRKGER